VSNDLTLFSLKVWLFVLIPLTRCACGSYFEYRLSVTSSNGTLNTGDPEVIVYLKPKFSFPCSHQGTSFLEITDYLPQTLVTRAIELQQPVLFYNKILHVFCWNSNGKIWQCPAVDNYHKYLFN